MIPERAEADSAAEAADGEEGRSGGGQRLHRDGHHLGPVCQRSRIGRRRRRGLHRRCPDQRLDPGGQFCPPDQLGDTHGGVV